MWRVACFALLLPLASCGPRYVWVKDVPQEELTRDRYECERDMRAGAMSFGTGIVGQLNANDFMGRCFQAKGYRLQAVGEPQPAADPMRQYDFDAEGRAKCRDECLARDADGECYNACTARYPTR